MINLFKKKPQPIHYEIDIDKVKTLEDSIIVIKYLLKVHPIEFINPTDEYKHLLKEKQTK